jgi:hypothetical protein
VSQAAAPGAVPDAAALSSANALDKPLWDTLRTCPCHVSVKNAATVLRSQLQQNFLTGDMPVSCSLQKLTDRRKPLPSRRRKTTMLHVVPDFQERSKKQALLRGRTASLALLAGSRSAALQVGLARRSSQQTSIPFVERSLVINEGVCETGSAVPLAQVARPV